IVPLMRMLRSGQTTGDIFPQNLLSRSIHHIFILFENDVDLSMFLWVRQPDPRNMNLSHIVMDRFDLTEPCRNKPISTMTLIKTSISRRSFLKVSALAGGGMMLSFNWLGGCKPSTGETSALPKEWFEMNGFLKIGDNGLVTIMSPNPEGGQNVKTSMPMIVAEELDVNWEYVIVEQAPLNTNLYTRQFIGGSQAIRQGWKTLRMAGATARYMLQQAAAQAWQVPAEEITTEAGVLHHKGSGKSAAYGEMASAAALIAVPEAVDLKNKKEFKIIGTSRKNVDAKKIITGQPLFGVDYHHPGMLIAMITHPPAFGMKLKSLDDSAASSMPGIKDVFTIKTLKDDYERQYFDTCTFTELVAI